METVCASSDSPLFTRKEAANRLRISLGTLNKLLQTNQLSSITIGRKRLIQQSVIEAFIEKGGAK